MRPYGQHFLNDKSSAIKLVELISHDVSNRRVVEIGAGKGFITGFLLQAGFQVLAYEIDQKLAKQLCQKFAGSGLKVYVKDFLQSTPEEIENINLCIGSIPYQISSKIIIKLIELGFQKIVLIVQKEFAEKLVAEPGEKRYSFITVLAQSFYDVQKVSNLPKSCFSPAPKVDSAILSMCRNHVSIKIDEYILFLRKIFVSPNKMVHNMIHSAIKKRVRELPADEFLRLFFEEGQNGQSGVVSNSSGFNN